MALECRPVDCLAYADSPNYCPQDLMEDTAPPGPTHDVGRPEGRGIRGEEIDEGSPGRHGSFPGRPASGQGCGKTSRQVLTFPEPILSARTGRPGRSGRRGSAPRPRYGAGGFPARPRTCSGPRWADGFAAGRGSGAGASHSRAVPTTELTACRVYSASCRERPTAASVRASISCNLL